MTYNMASRIQNIPSILQEGLQMDHLIVQGELNETSAIGIYQSAGVGRILYVGSISLKGKTELVMAPEEPSLEDIHPLSHFLETGDQQKLIEEVRQFSRQIIQSIKDGKRNPLYLVENEVKSPLYHR